VTAIGICAFTGWAWADGARREITNGGLAPFGAAGMWLFSARFLAPIGIGLILLSGNWKYLAALFG
jgi:hypothetical protein